MSTDDPTPVLQTEAPKARDDSVPEYEIRVDGRLASRWSAWFDGLTITADGDGTTVIRDGDLGSPSPWHDGRLLTPS